MCPGEPLDEAHHTQAPMHMPQMIVQVGEVPRPRQRSAGDDPIEYGATRLCDKRIPERCNATKFIPGGLRVTVGPAASGPMHAPLTRGDFSKWCSREMASE